MRVLLADHHETARWAIRTLLQEVTGFEIVGEATDGASALKLAKEQRAELVLVDGELPDIYIADLIADLHALERRPMVIVMSSYPGYSGMLLKAGADAFISKGNQPALMLETLRRYLVSK